MSRGRALLGLAVVLVGVVGLSLFVGRYPAPFWTPPAVLGDDPLARQIVLNLRLPRVLAACMLGMALAAAGAVLQMIFRNPLVEPGFLGVSQGAAFGAAFSIVFLEASGVWMQGLATLFAGAGLAFSYLLARHIRYGGWTLRLVLAGIAVSALFAAVNGLLKYVADPLTQLPELTFWLLGGLSGVTWRAVALMAPMVALALVVMMLMRWRLNILSLDDETAFSLGTVPSRERTVLLVAAVVATASVVSVAGIIGWAGLIVPHIARRWFGADGRWSLPASVLIGGIFVVLCDDVGRAALRGEIPLGILTSLLGSLAFAAMMVRPARRR